MKRIVAVVLMFVLVSMVVVACGQTTPEQQEQGEPEIPADVSPLPEFSPAPGLEPPVGVTAAPEASPLLEESPEASPEAIGSPEVPSPEEGDPPEASPEGGASPEASPDADS